MNKEIKKKLTKLSKSLMMEVNDYSIEDVVVGYDSLQREIDLLNSIDVTNIEPMTRIDSTPITYLREDIPSDTIKQEFILQNAPNVFENFVVVKKVKND